MSTLSDLGIDDSDLEAPEVADVEAVAEAPPVEAAAPADAPADPDPAGDKPPPGYVPHAALHAERQRVQQLKAQMARYDDRIAMLQGQANTQAASARPADDDDDPDPVALLQEVKHDLSQFQQQQRQQQEDQQLSAYVERDLAQFREAKPDLPNAVDFLIQSRAQELQMMGHSDDEIRQDINAWDTELTRNAARAGLSVAEIMYNLASIRGYRTAAPAAAPAAGAPAATDMVAAIAKGQASERSLSGVSAAAPAGELDLQAILALPDDEFAKIAMNDSRWRKLAGG